MLGSYEIEIQRLEQEAQQSAKVINRLNNKVKCLQQEIEKLKHPSAASSEYPTTSLAASDKTTGLNRSSYELTTSGLYRNDNTASRVDRYKYNVSSYDVLEPMTDKYASYGTTVAASEWTNDSVIHTNSQVETNDYLLKFGANIYKDPNPQIIRRTLKQRVLVRYLHLPNVPPPGPLIIKEVRPPQPPPPPPLIIHEHASTLRLPPPLILRERPPTPPTLPEHIPSETTTRYLPAVPTPPRSVIVERYPSLAEMPRDIIIERWIPYGPQPQPQTARRTIVECAPPAIEYPPPQNMTIIYGMYALRRKKLRRNPENPADYIARYGGSLLDSATLVQTARNVGVYEDISPPVHSS
ncbi:unnamed protein product [Rotaria sordida]|uniref:Uncharacterized protein n=1 Tax=Rotaria sordida TaxID=392033 RepID=A0A818ZFW2_9BILA|nr:unnamed protein product [Rotaria sordida]